MREIYECSFITTRLIATKNWDSLGIKYSILYMKAIKALQEAMAKIETLEADVKTLKGE